MLRYSNKLIITVSFICTSLSNYCEKHYFFSCSALHRATCFHYKHAKQFCRWLSFAASFHKHEQKQKFCELLFVENAVQSFKNFCSDKNRNKNSHYNGFIPTRYRRTVCPTHFPPIYQWTVCFNCKLCNC